jgi:PGDYG protein
MLRIEEGGLDMFPFRPFRKVATLKARMLTEDDHKQRNGAIQTLEGNVAFEPGDYLMLGVENEEWPMTQDNFQITYERISPFDREGFAFYQTNDVRMGYQVPEAFLVKRTNGDVLKGKAGDYLVKSGDKCWIADRYIFERSYEAVS